MSETVEWSTAKYNQPTVLRAGQDPYGEVPEDADHATVDEGNYAIVLGTDTTFVIEGTGQELYDLAAKLIELAAPLRAHAEDTRVFEGGEFIIGCSCGRSFASLYDFDDAGYWLAEHINDPALDDVALTAKLTA